MQTHADNAAYDTAHFTYPVDPIVSMIHGAGETQWWFDAREMGDFVLPIAVERSNCTHVVMHFDQHKLTQTSTTQIVKANDGATTVGTSTVSDDGTTATRGKFS